MILVTGGTGLLGNHLLHLLSQSENCIRSTYRSEKKQKQSFEFFKQLSPSNFTELWNKIEWIKADILDIPKMEEVFDGITHVYHCAALVSFHKNDFKKLIQINRKGTENIVNLCLSNSIEKLCYVSSTAAIGGDGKSMINEETKWEKTPTTSGYSISKYSAEKEVWRGIEEGLNAVIVNPCVILGAGNWNDSSLTLLRTVAKKQTFFPPGSNAIVDARDVSQIMQLLMESSISAERFLCIGNNQSFEELIRKSSQQMNIKPPTKQAKKWMVNIAYGLLWLGSVFSSKQPSLTRETINSLFSNRKYSAKKIKKASNFEFHSLEETIEYSVKNRVG